MIVLRILAVLVAIGGVLDPAWQVTREAPVAVRLWLPPDDPEAAAAAGAVRAALSGRVDLVESGTGLASVVVGGARIRDALDSGGAVSVVSLEEPASAALVRVPSTVTLTPGSAVDIPVTVRAIGLDGRTTVAVLEQDGVELARAEHAWTGGETATATVRLPYVAPSPGVRRLTVRLLPSTGVRHLRGGRADLLAMAAERPSRIGVIEARPSWPAGFARRELERDPAFEVSAVMRVSTGVASRAGKSPPVIRPDQLTRFDVVIVGAPEELRRQEVDVLWEFVERRGGTLLLLPDKAPTGPYVERLPGRFSEHLVNEPRTLEPSGILASEILSIARVPPGGRALARFDGAPAIVSWPAGEGQVVFSGALDAWRYRAHPKSTLTRFWRDELLSAAFSAPPAVRLELSPAVARPGGRTRVTVRLRRTEFQDTGQGGGELAFPAVEARLSDPRGRVESIRLWPGAEAGTFYGDVSAAEAGVHMIRAATEQGSVAETTLLAADDATSPFTSATDLERVPELTGGVTVRASSLDPLVQHLSALPRPVRQATVSPFRSAWWPWIFSGLLCGEWALRRRTGLK